MVFLSYSAEVLPKITLIGKDTSSLPHKNIRRISDDYIFYLVTSGELFVCEENGEIAAVVIGDEATLKRVYKTADGIMLVAENPAYQPMYFSGDELNQTYVLGKAIGFQSMNLN